MYDGRQTVVREATALQQPQWTRDIVMVNPNELVPHPRRDEAGERYDTPEAMDNLPTNLVSLQANILQNGIREPLLVQRSTNILMTGHFRRAVAIQAGWTEVPVQYLDVTDEEAYAIMLADNWERNTGIMEDYMAVARNMFYFALRLKLLNEIDDDSVDISPSRKQEGTVPSFSSEIVHLVSKKFERSRAVVRKHFALLKLIPELQHWISEKKIGFEGGAMLAGMSEQAQRDFMRDYADWPKISDSDIKAFRNTWESIVERQTNGLGAAEKPISIPEPSSETLVAEWEEMRSDESVPHITKYASDAYELSVVADGGRHQPMYSAEKRSISIVDVPEHKTLLARNRLALLVKKQRRAMERMTNELSQQAEALMEEIKEGGLQEMMEDIEQLEFHTKGMLALIENLKLHDREAVQRLSDIFEEFEDHA